MSLSTGLFDRQTPKPPARPLLQFKAGKMSMKEDHSVQPDTRKGCAYLYQTTGDQTVHFCWFDRRTGLIEDNFVLTPKEAEFKRVSQCKTGRVYVLKLKENQKRFFLWMQEPNASSDSGICEAVNKFINSPPAPPSSSLSTGASSRITDLFGSVRGLSNLSQSDILALLSMGAGLGGGLSSEGESSALPLPTPGGRHLNSSRVEAPSMHTAFASSVPAPPRSSSATAEATNATPTDQAANRLRLQDLHSILSTLETPAQRPAIDLSLGLDAESLRDLVQEENGAVADRLAAHLPAPDPEDRQPSAPENIINNLRSPQLHGALKSFSDAFHSGNMGPVLSQFNLGEGAVNAAQSGSLEKLASVLQGTSDSKPKAATEEKSKKAMEDEDDEEQGKRADGHDEMDTS